MESVSERSVERSRRADRAVDLGFACCESREGHSLREGGKVGDLNRQKNLKLCQLLTHLRHEFLDTGAHRLMSGKISTAS